MDDSVADLLTGVCGPCGADDHDRCIGETVGDSCLCNCTGTVICPTCDSTVVLYADPDEPGLSNGYCCHWMWADWWDGTFRYDLRGAVQGVTAAIEAALLNDLRGDDD